MVMSRTPPIALVAGSRDPSTAVATDPLGSDHGLVYVRQRGPPLSILWRDRSDSHLLGAVHENGEEAAHLSLWGSYTYCLITASRGVGDRSDRAVVFSRAVLNILQGPLLSTASCPAVVVALMPQTLVSPSSRLRGAAPMALHRQPRFCRPSQFVRPHPVLVP